MTSSDDFDDILNGLSNADLQSLSNELDTEVKYSHTHTYIKLEKIHSLYSLKQTFPKVKTPRNDLFVVNRDNDYFNKLRRRFFVSYL